MDNCDGAFDHGRFDQSGAKRRSRGDLGPVPSSMEEDYKHGLHPPREQTVATKGKAATHVSEERLVEITQQIRDHFTDGELRHLGDCDECSEVLSLFVCRCIHG